MFPNETLPIFANNCFRNDTRRLSKNQRLIACDSYQGIVKCVTKGEESVMLKKSIKKLRTDAKLSQEQFAQIFGVSKQSVQKWENGETVPELAKLIKISRYFGISLDALIMNNDNRVVEEMSKTKNIKPQYANIHDWEFYSSDLMTEYTQSVEEGLDVEIYQDVFSAVSRLPKDELRKKLGDVLFETIINANVKPDYPYKEPSDLETIRTLRKPYAYKTTTNGNLEKQIYGAYRKKGFVVKLWQINKISPKGEPLTFLGD